MSCWRSFRRETPGVEQRFVNQGNAMSDAGSDDQPLALPTASLAFKKRQTIWHGSLVCGLFGTIDALFALQDRPSDWWIAEGFAAALFALRWCALDSQALGRRLGRWMGLTVFLIALVGVPIYLLRTRGMWRGLVASGVFAGLVCLLAGLAWGFANCLIAISDWRHGEVTWRQGEFGNG